MASVIYALTLQGLKGSSLSGTLSFGAALPLSATPGEESPQFQAGERVWVYVDQIAGSLLVPGLTGPEPVPLSGILFVSEYGPPISFILTGTCGQAAISLQFNLIDSPGQCFGGGLGYRPEGAGTPVVPYSVLGAREG